MGNINLQNKKQDKYLKEQLESGNFVGFMLFVGQAGSGKFSTAHSFARSVLCSNISETHCNNCKSCKLTEKGNHPDLLVTDNSETIKISQIRELQKNLYLKPYLGEHKVAIINDAQLMTPESANALLKMLEEPPKDSVIILITTDKTLLPETIVSRSQVVNFGTNNLDGLNEDISEAMDVLESKTVAERFEYAKDFSKDRTTANSFLDDMESILRQVFLLESDLNMEYNEKWLSTFEKIKERYPQDKIIKLLELTARSREYLKSNLSSRFVLENLIINM